MSFPRRYARTRRFTLGIPRNVSVSPDGATVLFLRSRGPEDAMTDLWRWRDGEEVRLLAGDRGTDEGADAPGPAPAERARRERLREMAAGVTSYATDRRHELVVVALDGRLLLVDVASGDVTDAGVPGPVFDPRPSPDGSRVAYVLDDGLHVVERDGRPTVLAQEPDVTWGLADFVAAEEMHRYRGFWWSPDGTHLAACRVDERDVPIWHIADPAEPARAPAAHRYPAAGTTNPDVRLAILAVPHGDRVDVRWDREAFPYLASVAWPEGRGPVLLVQDRSQRHTQLLEADPATGATEVVAEQHDPDWVELVAGSPSFTDAGRLVTVEDRRDHGTDGTRALVVDGEVVSAPGLWVDEVVGTDGEAVWFTAFDGPFDIGVHVADLDRGEVRAVTTGEGVHGAAVAGGTAVLRTSDLHGPPTLRIRRGDDVVGGLAVDQAEPGVVPRPRFLRLGPRGLPAALLLPSDEEDGKLPVLLSPYGGPGPSQARRVRRSRDVFLEAQWFADQGFAVLVVDNRGMTGVSVAFERAIAGDLAGPVLEDQVAGLEAAAEEEPRLDLDRVSIRGWSFGGFLAALAVLRRPDVFHAGIAGAPVTDWRLYDTHYTERYLGSPHEEPDAYRRSSVVDADGQLVDAQGEPPHGRLLVIHGLADDNVVAAHSLRLSGALLAAGRPHRFLPLTGVTHMTPQEVVAENLLLLQLDFLRESLGL